MNRQPSCFKTDQQRSSSTKEHRRHHLVLSAWSSTSPTSLVNATVVISVRVDISRFNSVTIANATNILIVVRRNRHELHRRHVQTSCGIARVRIMIRILRVVSCRRRCVSKARRFAPWRCHCNNFMQPGTRMPYGTKPVTGGRTGEPSRLCNLLEHKKWQECYIIPTHRAPRKCACVLGGNGLIMFTACAASLQLQRLAAAAYRKSNASRIGCALATGGLPPPAHVADPPKACRGCALISFL